MNNTYIQDKLLEKHICRFNDGECNCDCYIAGMTDYHNHIVEKIPKKIILKNMYGDGWNDAIEVISNNFSTLQDTNPKE